MRCPRCGVEVSRQGGACPKCGAWTAPRPPASAGRPVDPFVRTRARPLLVWALLGLLALAVFLLSRAPVLR